MTRDDGDARAARRGCVALAATLAIQVYVSLAATATSVLAPRIAPAFALPPELVGVFVGLLYVGSMAGSLAAGGLLARFGPIRVSQASVLLAGLGLALVPLAPGSGAAWLALAIAPIVLGLGYGPITPASSQVLAHTAPPSRMALTFSIKQTGVPAGAALAGALLPALVLVFDWRATMALVAVAGVAVALAAQPVRADFDRERDPARAFSLRALLAPLRDVVTQRGLANLSLLGFFYAATQVSLTSYLVVYLAQAHGRTLVVAGAALSVTTIGGVFGRIAWGIVADRARSPRGVLGVLGIVAGACSLVTAAWPAGFAPAALFAVLALFGATAIGWNGVYLAEVARLAPRGEAGAVTGASGFVTFAGVVCGPPAFAALAAGFGSYRAGFAALGASSLLAAGAYLVRSRRAAQ